jgi:hypothetical protein
MAYLFLTNFPADTFYDKTTEKIFNVFLKNSCKLVVLKLKLIKYENCAFKE